MCKFKLASAVLAKITQSKIMQRFVQAVPVIKGSASMIATNKKLGDPLMREIKLADPMIPPMIPAQSKIKDLTPIMHKCLLSLGLLATLLAAPAAYAQDWEGTREIANAKDRTLADGNQEVFLYLEVGDAGFLRYRGVGCGVTGCPLTAIADLTAPDGTTFSSPASTSGGAETVYALPAITAANEGVWRIAFRGANTTETYYTWGVTARDASNTATSIPGRVWVEELKLRNEPYQGMSHTFYGVANTGHVFSYAISDYIGEDSSFTFDKVGNNTGDCVPLFKSVDSTTGVPGNCDKHKLFFNPPDTNMPTTATYFDGRAENWVYPDLVEATIDSVTNVRTCDAPYATDILIDITGTAGATYDGKIDMIIDTNGDGQFDENDVLTQGTYTAAGLQTISFDGLDPLGNPVTISPLNFEVQIAAGAAHLNLHDVEGLGGLTVNTIRPAGGPATELFWDDTELSTAGRTSLTSITDGSAGVQGTNLHGWSYATVGSNQWGNNRLIDSWINLGTDLAPLQISPPDFGDAPDSYGTLGASAGPCHYAPDTNLSMGAAPSLELDGQPDAAASTDTSDDGVSWPAAGLIIDEPASQDVTVVNTTGADAFLNVWIDFNGDGDFLDAGEQIATDQVVADAATLSTLNFTVPAGATEGDTFARLRLCATAAECATPAGLSTTGEVEDYLILLASIDITVDKQADTPVDNGDGTVSVDYTLTVTNSGTGAGTYGLTDTLTIPAGVNAAFDSGPTYVVAPGNENNTDGSVGTLPAGTVSGAASSTNQIVTSETLAGGAMEQWTYTVTYQAVASATEDACNGTDTGVISVDNQATLDNGNSSTISCVDVPISTVSSCNESTVPGAEALYTFEGNFNDISGNGHNPTSVGAGVTLDTDALEGAQAATYDGTGGNGSGIVIDDAFFNAAFTTRTMSMFIKPTVLNIGQTLYEEGGLNNGIELRLASGGNLILFVTEGGVVRSTSIPFPTDGDWHQVGFVYDGSAGVNQAWLYLDGYPVGAVDAFDELAAHGSGASLFQQNGTSAGSTSATVDRPYTGLIDDVAVYSSALTPKNMLDIADCAIDNLLTDLVGVACPTSAYLVQSATGDWYDVDLITGEYTLGSDNLNIGVNAIGFNELDGRIWGACRDDTDTFCERDQLIITSINADGTYTSTAVGPIAGVPALSYTAGDVYNGVYYLGNGSYSSIYAIDADASSPTYLQVINTITLSTTFGSADFAVNPVDGFAYAVSTTGNLIRIDLSTGTVTDLGPAGAFGTGAFGAVYFDDQGFFYAANNNSGEISRIDLSTDPGTDYDESKTLLFANGPASSANDGARCPGPLPIDWGDAPDSYGTLLEDDGPRHGNSDFNTASSTSSLTLGSNITIESNAQPDAAAGLDGNDDGITWPTLNADADYTETISLVNTTGADAYLNVWIDYNGDGDFLDAGEQITSDQVVANAATSAPLNFTVPKFAAGGTSFARLRLCGGTGECNIPTGSAAIGEVEDYLIELITVEDITVDKAITAGPTATATPNQYTVDYTITAANAGNGAGLYTLADDLQYGDGITIDSISAVTASANVTTTVTDPEGTMVTDEPILAGVDLSTPTLETYLFTVTYTVGTSVTTTSGDCTLDAGESGTGILNEVTMTSGGTDTTSEACVPVDPIAAISIDKTAGVPVATANPNEYTVAYTLTVENTGNAAGAYTLADDLQYGDGVTVGTISAVTTSANVTTLVGTVEGTIVVGEPIAALATETFDFTVTYTVETTLTTTAGDCTEDAGEAGTGTFNQATLTVDGTDTTAEACQPVDPIADVIVDKGVSTTVNPDGSVTADYTITVTNNGGAAGTYGITDSLSVPAGVTATFASTTPVGSSPDGTLGNFVSPLTGAATSDTVIVTGDSIAAGASETWTYTVTYVASDTADSADSACTPPTPGNIGVANVATLDDGTTSPDVCVEVPLSDVIIAKSVITTVNGDGSVTADYTITVTNNGTGPSVYGISDSLTVPAGVTATYVSVTPVGSDPSGAVTDFASPIVGPSTSTTQFITGDNIAAGASETWTYSVTYVASTMADEADSECATPTAGSIGATNIATLDSGTATPEVCAEIPLPDITVDKTVSSGPTPTATANQYTVEYTITAANAGAGPGQYTLEDDLQYGVGVTVDSISAVTASANVSTGVTDPEGILVTDEPILAAVNPTTPTLETYLFTVTYTVGTSVTTTSGDCTVGAGESGSGTLNEVTMTVAGATSTATACEPVVPIAQISIDKTAATPVATGNPNEFTVAYTLTVENTGGAASAYTLADDLQYGDGVTVGTISAVTTSPNVTTLLGAVEGTLVLGEPIDASAAETFDFTVTYTVETTLTATAGDCTEDAGEAGTGTFNEATLTVGGVGTTATACEPVDPIADLTIDKGVSSTVNADGTVTADYTITVTNNGGGAGTYGVTDSLSVPAGMTATFASTTPLGSSPDGTVNNFTSPITGATTSNTVIVTGDNIVAGASETWTYTVTYEASATAVDTDSECATPTAGSIGASNVASLDDGTSTPEVCTEVLLPDVSIEKAVSSTVNADGTVTADYTITVTNSGTGAGTYGVSDSLSVPAGMTATFASTTPLGSSPDGTVNNFTSPITGQATSTTEIVSGDLIAGGAVETWTYTVTYEASATAVDTDSECATPTAGSIGASNIASLDDGTSTPEVCAEVLLPDVSIEKAVSSTVNADGTVTADYTITVTNSGTGAGTYGVSDSLSVPAGMTATFASTTPLGSSPDGTVNNFTSPITGQATSTTEIVSGDLIAGGAVETWTYTVTYEASATAVDTDSECATPTAGSIGASNIASLDDGTSTPEVCAEVLLPDVSIEKAVSSTVNADGTVTADYTITVTNSGTGAGTYGVSDSLSVPAGMTATFASTTPLGSSPDGTVNNFTSPITGQATSTTEIVSGDLIAGGAVETWTYTVTYEASATAVDTDSECATPTAGSIGASNIASLDDGTSTPEVCAEVLLPDVSIEKAVSSTVNADGTVTADYTITVTNSGTGAGTYGVSDSLSVPAGMTATFASTTPLGSSPDGTVNNFTSPITGQATSTTEIVSGDLIAGGAVETWTYTVTYEASATAVDTDSECATPTAGSIGASNIASLDDGTSTPEVCTEVLLPDVSIEKAVSSTVNADGTVTADYTITVTNSGTGAGTYGVSDSLSVPAGMTATFASTTPLGSSPDGTVNNFTSPITGQATSTTEIVSGDLIAGGAVETWTYTVTYEASATAVDTDSECATPTAGSIGASNIASLDDGTSTPEVCTEVLLPDVSIEKAVSSTVNADGTVTADYTITVTNSGTGAGTYGVSDSLSVPAGMTATFASTTPLGSSPDGTVNNFTSPITGQATSTTEIVSGDLIAGGAVETWTYTVTYEASATAVDTDSECATPTAGSIGASNIASLDDGTSTPEVCAEVLLPDVSIEKAVSSTVNADGTVTADYTITVTNSGTGAGTYGVSDSLSVPAGMTATFASTTPLGSSPDGTVNNFTSPITGQATSTTEIVSGDLIAGGAVETWTYTVTYEASATAVDTDSECATPTAGSIGASNVASLDDGTSTPEVCTEVLLPDVSIEKAVSSTVNADGTVTADYTITVTNSGTGAGTYGVSDSLSVPAGMTATFASTTPLGSSPDGTVNNFTSPITGQATSTTEIVSGDLIAGGAVETWTYTVTYEASATAVDTDSECATPTAGSIGASNIASLDDGTSTPEVCTEVLLPDVSIEKAVSSTVNADGTVTADYTITVTNSGTGAGTYGVSDSLSVPAGMTATFASTTPLGSSPDGTVNNFTSPITGQATSTTEIVSGDLIAGGAVETWTYTVTYEASATAVDTDSECATPTAGSIGASNIASLDDGTSTPEVCAEVLLPDVSIEKAVSSTVNADGTVTADYTITVTNSGTGAGTYGVSDSLSVPAGMTATFASTTPLGSSPDGTVNNFTSPITGQATSTTEIVSGDLIAGGAVETWTYTVTYEASATAVDTDSECATPTAGSIGASNIASLDDGTSTPEVCTEVLLPDVSIEKAVSSTVNADGTVTADYTITVTNSGTGAGTYGVSDSLTVPAGVTATFVTLMAVGSSADVAVNSFTSPLTGATTSNTVIVTGDNIAAGASETWTYTVTYVASDTADEADSTCIPPTPGSIGVSNVAGIDNGTETPRVCVDVPLSDVIIAKTVDTTVNLDGSVTADYTITVTNNGVGPTTYGVSDSLTVPAGVTATFVTLMAVGSSADVAVNSFTSPLTGATTSNTVIVSGDLIAGGAVETWTYTVTYEASATAVDTDSECATPTAGSIGASNVAALDNGSATPEVCTEVLLPDVSIEKAVSSTVNADGTVTADYTITVTNSGTGAGTYGVSDSLSVPAGMTATFASTTPLGSSPDGTVNNFTSPITGQATSTTEIVSGDLIAGGAVETWTYTVTYEASATAVDTDSECATPTAGSIGASNIASLDDGTSTPEVCTEVLLPDVSIEKAVSSTVNADGTVTADYTITVTNSGTGAGTYGVSDSLSVPAGMTATFASTTPLGSSPDGTVNNFTSPISGQATSTTEIVTGDLIAGGAVETWTYTVTYEASATAVDTDSECATPTAGSIGASNVASLDDGTSTPEVCAEVLLPDVSIEKAVSSTVNADGTVTADYTITVTNSGTGAGTYGVSDSLSVPAGMTATFASTTPLGSSPDGTVNNFTSPITGQATSTTEIVSGDLIAGGAVETWTYTVTYEASATAVDTDSECATPTAGSIGASNVASLDDGTSTPEVCTEVLLPDVSIEKAVSSTVNADGTVTADYTITVTNSGTGAGTYGVSDSLSVPAGMTATFASTTPLGSSPDGTVNNFTSPISGQATSTTEIVTGDLIAGGAVETWTYTVTYEASATAVDTDSECAAPTAGSIGASNVASLDDGTTTPEVCTEVLLPDVSIEKAVSSTVNADGTVTADYTITVTNSGTGAGTYGVSDSLSVPAGMTATFASTTPLGSSPDGTVNNFTSPITGQATSTTEIVSGDLIAGGAVETWTYTVTYEASATAVDTDSECATPTAGSIGASNIASLDDGTTTPEVCTEVLLPDVSIEKAVSSTVNADGTVTADYTITVTNSGTGAGTYGVSDSLSVPAGMTATFASTTPLGSSPDGTVNNFTSPITGQATSTTEIVSGDLIAGGAVETWTYTVTYEASATAVDTDSECATPTAGSIGASNIASLDDGTSTPEVCTEVLLPDVSIEKAVSSTVNADGTVTADYTITVTNSGTGAGTYGVSDSLSVPAGMTATFASTTPLGSSPDGTVNNFTSPITGQATSTTEIVSGDLIAGGAVETWTYTVTYEASATAVDTDSECATPTAGSLGASNVASLDDGTSTPEVCTEVLLPDVSIEKAVSSTVNADGTVTADYTITVTNSGTGAGTYGVSDSLSVPAGMTATFVSTTPVGSDADGTLGAFTSPITGAATSDTVIVTGDLIAAGPGTVETWTYTVTYEASATAVDTDSECATPTAGSIGASNVASLDDGTSTPEVCTEVPLPEIAIEKGVSSTVNADGTVTADYTITVTNSGTGAGTYGVSDSLSVPAGMTATFVSTTPVGSNPDGTLGAFVSPITGQAISDTVIVTGDLIAGGAVETWTYTVTYEASATAVDTDSECAAPTAGSIGASNVATLDDGTSTPEVCTEVPLPEITVEKGVSASINADGSVTADYTITVTNSGTGSGVYDLDDSLTVPGEVAAVLVNAPAYGGDTDGTDGTIGTGFDTTGGVIVSGESLAGGASETWVYQLMYEASQDATADACDGAAPGFISVDNQATLDNGASSTETCVDVPLPDITVAKAVSSTVNADGSVTADYTITVINNGAGSGIYALSDTLTVPGEVVAVLVNAPAYGGDTDGTDGTIATSFDTTGGDIVSGESLAAGASETWVYQLMYAASETADAADTACGTPTPGQIGVLNQATLSNGASSTETCAEVPIPSMTIDKSSTTTQLGSTQSVTYTYILTNTGGAPLTDIDVVDDNVDGVVTCDATSLTVAPDPGSVTSCTAVHTFTQAELDANGSPVAASGELFNNVIVTTPQLPTGVTDTLSIPIVLEPAIELMKGVSDVSVIFGRANYLTDAGDEIYYNFEVNNIGPITLNNIVINDAKISDITCLVTTLAPGESTTCTGDPYVITDADMLLLMVENTATVTGTTPGGEDVEDVSDSTQPEDERGTPEDPTIVELEDPTVPITLGSFSSEAGLNEGDVVFEWSTQTEVSNIGFILYQKSGGQWSQLTDGIIAAQGDSVGLQEYRYEASGVKGRKFVLVDVDVYGVQTLHGPYELGSSAGAVGTSKITNWDAINDKSENKAERRKAKRLQNLERKMNQLQQRDGIRPSQPSLRGTKMKKLETSEVEHSQPKSKSKSKSRSTFGAKQLIGSLFSVLVPSAYAASAEELVNMQIEQEGVYQFTYAQLAARGVAQLLDGRSVDEIAVMNQGEPVALSVSGSTNNASVFGPGASVRFIGKGIDTLYTGTNVYTLVLDQASALRMQDDNRAIPGQQAESTYMAQKTYSPQLGYSFISPNGQDPWYAQQLLGLRNAVATDINMELDYYAASSDINQQPQLSVNIWGVTDLSAPGADHHVQVAFNGVTAGSARFDGIQDVTIDATVSNIASGTNKVTVSLPMDHGHYFEKVSLNNITVSYPRRFIADGHRLDFTATGGRFVVSKLQSDQVQVYRSDESGIYAHQSVDTAGSCATTRAYCYAQFAGTGAEAKYYVTTTEGMAMPRFSALPLAVDISSTPAEYLIISHPNFIDTTSQGLQQLRYALMSEFASVDLVDVQMVYAQYGNHIFGPQAIHDYIKHAAKPVEEGGRGTKYVLLVGGDMYDYRNYLNKDALSFIPSLYMATDQSINFSPVDSKYVDIDDDDIPDLALGRLPIRTEAELDILLNKRQAYLSRDYAGKVLFAADETDTRNGYNFKSDAQSIQANHFAPWDVTTAYSDDLGVASAKQRITDAVNAGQTLTSFFGHSSTRRWGFSGLFDGDDAGALNNIGKPTIVTQWGCWNTYYVSPDEDSMGHRFMLEGERGALAVMGASTQTSARAERELAQKVFAKLSEGARLGDAILEAKQDYAEKRPQQLDVILGWTLLGLPELTIQ